jgi:rhodanese-related sulfurtransferase
MRIAITLAITLAPLSLLTVPGCASTPDATAATPPTTTAAAAFPVDDADLVRQKVAAGAVVIDVRPANFAAQHPISATNIPFAEAEGRLAEIDALVGGDRSKPVVVVCGNGSMAIGVKAMLKSKGYADVSAQAVGALTPPAPTATAPTAP